MFSLSFSNISDNSAYDIITESNSITFSEVMNLNEGNISNGNFLWTSAKIGPNSNINEYMTTYSDKQAYFGSSSGARCFTTAH